MQNLREQLRELRRNQVCLVGVGNTDCGDDGFGVRLAERVAQASRLMRLDGVSVLGAGNMPEHNLAQLADGGYGHVIFLDAVEFGGEPGATVLLDSTQMAARFPQVSTHKLSLGLLARLIEANGRTRAWLLGVQPESLKAGSGLSPRVQTTLELLAELLIERVDLAWNRESPFVRPKPFDTPC